jgi:hypothetical protein
VVKIEANSTDSRCRKMGRTPLSSPCATSRKYESKSFCATVSQNQVMSKVITYRSVEIISRPFTFIIRFKTFFNQWSEDTHGIRYTFSLRCDKWLCKTAKTKFQCIRSLGLKRHSRMEDLRHTIKDHGCFQDLENHSQVDIDDGRITTLRNVKTNFTVYRLD